METKPPSASRREDDLAQAKRDFVAAAYRASPARIVERHPWGAVTATASATMAVTVIATSPLFSRAGVGMIRHGMGLATAAVKHPAAGPLISALVARFMPQANASAVSSSPDPGTVNAVG